MKYLGGFTRLFAVFGMVVVLLAQLGCETPTAAAARGQSMVNDGTIDTTYRPGDKVVIDFLDNPQMPQGYQQVVREDGAITLPLNQTVVVAGKQKGQVEKEIRDIYVPRLLKRLTVNVRAEDRTYFVRGEVKQPRQLVYTGAMSALRAIGAAGDFTDFANRKKIEIIRASGEKIMLNGTAALKDPSKDVPIYPGDTVYVHRRYF